MKKLMKILMSLAALVVFIVVNQQWLQVSKYRIIEKKLPKEFNGLRIVQISDLHTSKFGERQKMLIQKVKNQKPDLIVITGDLVDRYNYLLDQSLDAVHGFVKIAPVYYVHGNHEVSTNNLVEIDTKMKELGVHVLNNRVENIQKNGATIQIVGIDDPLDGKTADEMLSETMKNTYKDKFQILLAHRPEDYKVYEKYGMNLTFNGHEHGGQIRIPGIGGLFNHQFNLFPAHIDGVEQIGGLTQIISRGLGNTRRLIRLFNRPEIVVAILNDK